MPNNNTLLEPRLTLLSNRRVTMYSEQLPSTRCALLAKAIWDMCVVSGSEALYIAEEFYCGQHDSLNRLTLILRNDADFDKFKNDCLEHDIYATLTPEDNLVI